MADPRRKSEETQTWTLLNMKWGVNLGSSNSNPECECCLCSGTRGLKSTRHLVVVCLWKNTSTCGSTFYFCDHITQAHRCR